MYQRDSSFLAFPTKMEEEESHTYALTSKVAATYLVDTQPTIYFVDGPSVICFADTLSKNIFFPLTLRGSAIATSASIISK